MSSMCLWSTHITMSCVCKQETRRFQPSCCCHWVLSRYILGDCLNTTPWLSAVGNIGTGWLRSLWLLIYTCCLPNRRMSLFYPSCVGLFFFITWMWHSTSEVDMFSNHMSNSVDVGRVQLGTFLKGKLQWLISLFTFSLSTEFTTILHNNESTYYTLLSTWYCRLMIL